MSTRTTLRPYSVITNGNMAGNLTSLATVLQGITRVSYAGKWTGTSPVGTLSVQVSNDYSLFQDGTVNNPGSWSTITLNLNGTPSTTVPVSGNTGTFSINVDGIAAYAIRLIYTAGSGSGTIQAVITGKVS